MFMKKTVSLKNIEINTNSYAEQVYPKVTFDANGKEHKTIALKLNRQQAIDLATNILIGAKKWDEMYITAFRNANSISITVTSQQEVDDKN
jgi:hypothetical protein